MEMHASNNHDDLLLIRGILDNLRDCSDSQLSFLLNQSQILRGTSQLISSSQAPAVSVEITDPARSAIEGGSEGKSKEVNRLTAKAGSASVNVRGSNIDRSEQDGGLESSDLSNPPPPPHCSLD